MGSKTVQSTNKLHALTTKYILLALFGMFPYQRADISRPRTWTFYTPNSTDIHTHRIVRYSEYRTMVKVTQHETNITVTASRDVSYYIPTIPSNQSAMTAFLFFLFINTCTTIDRRSPPHSSPPHLHSSILHFHHNNRLMRSQRNDCVISIRTNETPTIQHINVNYYHFFYSFHQ